MCKTQVTGKLQIEVIPTQNNRLEIKLQIEVMLTQKKCGCKKGAALFKIVSVKIFLKLKGAVKNWL